MRILILLIGIFGYISAIGQPCDADRVWLIFERGRAEPFVFIEDASPCEDSMNWHCKIVRELRAFAKGEKGSRSPEDIYIKVTASERINRPYGDMIAEKWNLYSHGRMIGTSIYDRKDGELLLISVYDDYKAVAVQGGWCDNGITQVRYLLDDVLALSKSDEFGPFLPDLTYGE